MFDESFAPITKSRHRFARQNVFSPPTNFRPSSACSVIVHTLSGRTQCAQLKSFIRRIEIGQWCHVRKNASHFRRQRRPLLSFTPSGFHAQKLAHYVHSLVRVTRRDNSPHFSNTLNTLAGHPRRLHDTEPRRRGVYFTGSSTQRSDGHSPDYKRLGPST